MNIKHNFDQRNEDPVWTFNLARPFLLKQLFHYYRHLPPYVSIVELSNGKSYVVLHFVLLDRGLSPVETVSSWCGSRRERSSDTRKFRSEGCTNICRYNSTGTSLIDLLLERLAMILSFGLLDTKLYSRNVMGLISSKYDRTVNSFEEVHVG